MLVKVTNYSSYVLSVTLMDNTNTTPIDLWNSGATPTEMYAAPSPTLFQVYKAGDPNTSLSINSIAVVGSTATDGAKGQITITLESTPSISVGDTLLVTSGSATTADTPYSLVANSASIDTSIDANNANNTTQDILTPTVAAGTAAYYNFTLSLLQQQLQDVNLTDGAVVALGTPITVYGLPTIKSIKFSMVTSADLKGSAYSSNLPVSFSVTFYESANGSGTPINITSASGDILSVNFVPVSHP